MPKVSQIIYDDGYELESELIGNDT